MVLPTRFGRFSTIWIGRTVTDTVLAAADVIGEILDHRVRCPQVLPVLAGELVERHHPFPAAIERAAHLDMAVRPAPRLERPLVSLGLLTRLRVRDLVTGGGLLLFGR